MVGMVPAFKRFLVGNLKYFNLQSHYIPGSVVGGSVTGICRCPPFCQLACVDILRSTGWRTPDHWDAVDSAGDVHPYSCIADA